MLNGIGGRTVAEAKARMSYAEALQWFEYLKKRGTLNLGIRLEYGLAQIAMLICSAAGLKKENGGKFKLTDFTPHMEEPEMSITDLAKVLKH